MNMKRIQLIKNLGISSYVFSFVSHLSHHDILTYSYISLVKSMKHLKSIFATLASIICLISFSDLTPKNLHYLAIIVSNFLETLWKQYCLSKSKHPIAVFDVSNGDIYHRVYGNREHFCFCDSSINGITCPNPNWVLNSNSVYF